MNFLKASLLAALMIVAPQIASAQEPAPSLSFTVQGQISVAPDMATILVGVVAEAETAQEALDMQAKRMNAVLEAARAAGLADKDIRTSGLSLQPRYTDYGGGDLPPAIIGYRAANQVNAVVHDLTKTGGTLDALIEAGANEIGGVSFGLRNQDEATGAARQDALRRLFELRDFYESQEQISLGRMLALVEGGPPGYASHPEMQLQSFAATPVMVGELTISVTLSARFALSP